MIINNLASVSASTGGIAVSPSATLTFGPLLAGSTIYNGPAISGGGTVQMNLGSAGSMTMTNANTYTGPTVVTTGTLNVTNLAAIDTSSSINLVTGGASGSNFDFNLPATGGAYAGPIIGLGNLQVSAGTGASALILTGLSGSSNNYTGTTTVNAGTLEIKNAASTTIPTSQIVLSGASTLIDFNQAASTIGIVSGAISGTGGVIINGDLTTPGTGKVILTNTNSYGGSTNISNGTLQVNNLSSLPSASALNINTPATFILNQTTAGTFSNPLSGGGAFNIAGGGAITFAPTSSTFTGAYSITLGQMIINNLASVSASTGGIAVSPSATLTFGPLLAGSTIYNGPAISGGGTVQMNLGSAGSMTMTNANTYTGPTVVTTGTLNVTNLAAIATSSSINLVTGGASGSNFDFNLPATGGTYAGPITGLGNLQVSAGSGASALILTGLTSNSYTGTTTVNAGTLEINNAAATTISTSQIALNGASTLIDFNQAASTIGIVNGAISGTGGVIINGDLTTPGTGKVILTNTNSYGGSTNISNGTLQVNNLSSLPSTSALNINTPATFILNQSTPGTFSNPLSGGGAFDIVGGGAITFAPTTSTFTGAYSITLGQMIINNLASVSASLGGIAVSPSATLTFGPLLAGSTIYNGPAISGGGTVQVNLGSAGNMTMTNANTYTGPTVVTTGTLNITNLAAIATSSGINLVTGGASGSNFDFNLPATGGAYAGPITGPGNLQVSAGTGASALILTGLTSNSYTGTTTVNAGTLEINNAATTTISTSQIVLSGASTLIDFNQAASTIGTVSGAISGTGGVIINGDLTTPGTGKVILTNTNSYAGSTNISNGTLQVNNLSSLPSASALNINTPATFILNQTTPGTFLNPLSGGGAFNIVGGGAITFDPTTSTFTGAYSITLGQMIINNLASVSTSLGGIAVSPSATLTFGPLLAGSTTYNGPAISGGGTVQVNLGSAGTMTMTNANTYTGPTVVTTGTLNVTNLAAIATSSGINLVTGGASGSNFDFNLPATGGTYAGPITGLGNLQVSAGAGASALILTGLSGSSNNYTGTTTVNAGTLEINNAATTTIPTSQIVLNGASTSIDFNQAASTLGTVNGAISGTGGVIINGDLTTPGTGTVLLTNTNSYTGSTKVSNGTLQVNNLSSLPSASALNINTPAIFILNQTTPGTFLNPLSGGGAFNIVGGGAITFDPTSSTFTGPYSITLGQMIINNLASVATASGIAVSPSATLTFGALTGIPTYNGPPISGGGTVQVNIGSGHSMTMTNANTYTGPTVITTGTLNVTTLAAIATSSSISLVTGGTSGSFFNFDFPPTGGTYAGQITGPGNLEVSAGTGASALILTGLSGSGSNYTGTTTVNTGTLEINNAATTTIPTSEISLLNSTTTSIDFNQAASTIGTVSGQITGIGGVIINGDLTTPGTGTVIFSNTTNNYTGSTNVSSGTFQVNNLSSLPSASALNINTPATFILNQSTAGTFLNPLSGGGVFKIVGGGAITFDPASSTFTGQYSITLGQMIINNLASVSTASGIAVSPNATFTFGPLIGSTIYNGPPISGGGTVQVNVGNTGSITMTNANTYTGPTVITTGTLNVTTLAAIASSSSINLVSGGATPSTLNLNVPSSGGTYAGPITGAGNLIVSAGTGTNAVILTGLSGSSANYTGTTTVNSGTLEFKNAATTIIPTSQIVLNGAGTTVDFNQGSGTMGTVNGAITGSGGVLINGDATSPGTGTVLFTNANSYTGSTNVSNGTLQVNNLSSLPSASTLNISAPGTFILNQPTNGTFSNPLTGAGTFDIIGGGAITFGINEPSFTGTTVISKGQLILNNILGGDLIVKGTAKLSGIGTVLGNLRVTDMATISPGNSIGTFNVGGNYRQDRFSTYLVQVEIEPNGVLESSLINIGGTAQIGDNANVHVLLLNGAEQLPPNNNPQSTTILHAAGGVSGTYAFANTSFPLIAAILEYTPNSVLLSFANRLSFIPYTHNQKVVSEQLQSILTPTPAENEILIGIASLPLPLAREALDQLSGEQYTDLMTFADYANARFIQSLFDPLRDVLRQPYNSNNCGSSDGLGFDVWAQGSGHQLLMRQNVDASGYKLSGYEFNVGAQGTINKFTLGGAFSHEVDHIHFGVGGSGKTLTNLVGLFGLYRPANYYVLADIIGGYSHDGILRTIDPGIGKIFRARSNPRLYQGGYYVEAGKDVLWRYIMFQPFVGFRGGFFHFNRISEKGASPLNLTIASKTTTITSSRLGFHISTRKIPDWGKFGVDLAWEYRWGSTGKKVTADFESFGTPFVVWGTDPQRHCFEATINFEAEFQKNWIFVAEVSGQSWLNAMSYSATAGIQAAW